MKKLILLLLICSAIYSQDNQFGLRAQLGINTRGASWGAGLNYAYHISNTSTIRLLIEYSYVGLDGTFEGRSPLVTALNYNLFQVKLQYLYYFPGRNFHVGVGIGKFNYQLRVMSGADLDETYYARGQDLRNTFGIDILAGATFNKLLSAEINYIYSNPELSSEVTRPDIGEDFYEKTQIVNMSTLYLNLIFSVDISSIDL